MSERWALEWPWKVEKWTASGTDFRMKAWRVQSGDYTITFGIEKEENARLLAAAPDLYAALAKYVEHFGDPLKCANAALAKARGESQ